MEILRLFATHVIPANAAELPEGSVFHLVVVSGGLANCSRPTGWHRGITLPVLPQDPCLRTLPHTAPQNFVSLRAVRPLLFPLENTVNHFWSRQWIFSEKSIELFPKKTPFAVSAIEPSLPTTMHLLEKFAERTTVSRNAIIVVMTTNL